MILSRKVLALSAWLTLAGVPCAAQSKRPASPATDLPKGNVPAGTKRALVICGHPGDEEHRKTFAETAARLHRGLTATAGIAPENISVFFGIDPETDSPKPEGAATEDAVKEDTAKNAPLKDDAAQIAVPCEGPATREAVMAAIEKFRGELQPDDSLWVIVFGHGHLDGRHVWINLPGPDIQQDDFGKLVKDLPCREQVFVIATPASGYYLKPLSATGRVVITATEPDLEINETLFAEALADQLNSTAENPLRDEDQDGAISLLDLYVAATRGLSQKYIAESLLMTEHALLDDNADGRGSELQRDYLTPDEGGRRRAGSVPPQARRAGQDGTTAASLRLPVAVPPPAAAAPLADKVEPKGND